MSVIKNFKLKNSIPLWGILVVLIAFSCSEKEEPIIDQEESAEIVRDMDGNEYIVVRVNGVRWLQSNLNTSTFQDGSAIPLVEDNESWSNLSGPGYSWFENIQQISLKGKLYNWEAVSCCKICPEGFKIPTVIDFDKVISALGNDVLSNNNIAGEVGIEPIVPFFISFGSLGAGRRRPNGEFDKLFGDPSWFTGFWTINETENNGVNIYDAIKEEGRPLETFLFKSEGNKKSGYSIKCVEE